MKVALITFHQNPTGGGAVAAADWLVKGLVERGIDVVEISSHRYKRSAVIQNGQVKTYRFFPWNLYWVGDKNTQSGPKKTVWQLIDTWNPQVYRTVRNILREEKPDVVHMMKLRGLSPSVWSAAAAVGCRPLVQTCHDYEVMSPDGVLQSRVGQWAREGKWMLRPYQSLRAGVSRHVDVATAPSRYTLATLTGRGFFPCACHRIVPNTHGYRLAEVEKHQEERKIGPRTVDEFHLLYLGRLEAIKGVDLLCAAVDHVAQTYPNLRLDVAGWGGIERQLRQQYRNHPHICFHGGVFGKEKESLLANADLLVLPSVWPEVFGIVVIEAYAYGKPVITTRTGGLPELVQEGETGFLATPGDVVSLQQAIAQAYEKRDLLPKMEEACFAAARRYSLENVTDQYLEAYESGLIRR
jgi:glycosyltransferase involved in cell wall biosynthesis